MRLLDTTTFVLRSDSPEFFNSEGYAILSHRWIGAEITFDEIAQYASSLQAADEKRIKSPQLDKIRGACETARKHGFRWVWIDSCCINKTSATEEAESINSMFKWYRNARVCITYLSDVRLVSEDRLPSYQAAASKQKKSVRRTARCVLRSVNYDGPSEWFARGWTLQELLAPHDMYFYDMNWKYLGTKTSLAPEIGRITGIDMEYLTGARHFYNACIATKMSWMAGRTTTRIEDIAYSMLGLFNVMMTPQYGEGHRAFMRLQQELVNTTTDESLFAWRMPEPNAGDRFDIERSPETTWKPKEWGLLAPSPDWFKHCGNVTGPIIERPARAFELGRQGIQFSVMPLKQYKKYKYILLLSPLTFIGAIPIWFWVAKKVKKEAAKGVAYPLNCWAIDESGTMAALSVYLAILPDTAKIYTGTRRYKFKRIRCDELPLSHDYGQRGVKGEGVVLQPELRFGD